MKSPITGKEMVLMTETVSKIGGYYDYQYYLCEDTGNRFTTTKLDEGNLNNFKFCKYPNDSCKEQCQDCVNEQTWGHENLS